MFGVPDQEGEIKEGRKNEKNIRHRIYLEGNGDRRRRYERSTTERLDKEEESMERKEE
jgi:hypothetical protein